MPREAKTWGPGFCDGQGPLLARLAFVVVFVGAICIFAVTQSAGAAESPCPNEAVRAAQSATFLPDCRAFELVSPPEGTPQLEQNAHILIGARASSNGGAIAWFSYYPLSGLVGGPLNNISTRGQTSWSTEPVGPRLSPTNDSFYYCQLMMFFSADLSASVLSDGRHSTGVGQTGEGECPSNDPALVAGEPEGFQNVFVRDNASGEYALANFTLEGVPPADAWLQDASDDFSHVVFEESAKLTESAPVGASLYEWVSGTVSLVTVLPDGTATVGEIPGAVVGGGNFRGTSLVTHPVSADGSRVIFESGAKPNLFLRENAEQKFESARGPSGECLESAKACTVQLDASLGGGGSFLAANATDTRIFFADNQHLYEYETYETQMGAETGVLRDLTPAGKLGLQGLSGISDDGSYLYLVAEAALSGKAVAGRPNLYVFHGGTVTFIATLGASDQEDSHDWTPGLLTSRVSPSGRYIAFNSIESLTKYDNAPTQPGVCAIEGHSPACREIFIYDAAQNELHCVSCTPGGARPTANAELTPLEASSPGWGPGYIQHNALDDGSVFFDTANSLLPAAVDGVSNVYEYEREELSLISSGMSSLNSFFYDASPSGGDLFFVTAQHLVQGDTSNVMSIYDARVGGGFSEPEAPALCSGEGCRAVAAGAPTIPALQTTSPQGSGNHRVTVLTRRQKLERALRACLHKRGRRRRVACKRRMQLRYGAHSSATKRGRGK